MTWMCYSLHDGVVLPRYDQLVVSNLCKVLDVCPQEILSIISIQLSSQTSIQTERKCNKLAN